MNEMDKKKRVINYLKKVRIAKKKDIEKMTSTSPAYIQELAQREIIIKCERGYYTLLKYMNEYIDYTILQKAHPQAIFSDLTALTLHGLADYGGENVYVTVPNTHGKISGRNIRTQRLSFKKYDEGIEEMTFGGFKLKLYSMERCLVHARKHGGIEHFLRALKRYAQLEGKPDFPEIRKFEKIFKTNVTDYLSGEVFEKQQDI